MASVTINGKTYVGNSITINNNRVIIDGKRADEESDGKGRILEVRIVGDLASLTCDQSVRIEGNVMGDVKASGSVQAGNVAGSVNAGGSVQAGRVGGDVTAGGSVIHH